MSKRVFRKFTNKRLKSLLNYLNVINTKYKSCYYLILRDGNDEKLYEGPVTEVIEDKLKEYAEYQVITYTANKGSYKHITYYVTVKPGNKEPFAKALTKKELLDYGFVNAYMDESNNWHIIRHWYYKSTKEKRDNECKLFYNTKPHPFGRDVTYAHVKFRYNGVGKDFQLARFLYVWFIGDIPDGYDIDHINDNSLDNRLENLRMLTHKENIRRRKGQCFNQFKNSVKQ